VDADAILQEITWIEKALADPDSVEHRIYLSNAPRKDLITRWASNLEKLHAEGKYHADINTISSHISNKFRAWKMDNAVHYVREVLDFKYKDSSKINDRYHVNELDDGSEAEPRIDSSNLLSFEAKNTNTLLISFMLHTIDALKSNIDRLRKDVILESKVPEDIAEQMFMNWEHVLKRHQEAWDGREKVLSTQQHLMAYALSGYSLNHAYVKYLVYAKEDTKLTEKQASKMMRLHINKIDKLFDPKTFQEAKELGFYGIQCPKCGSWRTEKRYNPDTGEDLMYCFDIHEDKAKEQWSPLKTMNLMEVKLDA
jgi:hypothetical protein